MYSTENYIKEVLSQEYCAEYRDIERFLDLCKACPNFNNIWSCPSFNDLSVYSFERYKYGYIIGTKIIINDATRYSAHSVDESLLLTQQILTDVRRTMDERLVELERQIAGSRVFYAGSCRLCPRGECSKTRNMPCIHPDKMRHSLESLGFDLARTSLELLNIELQWNNGAVLPEYFVLISAVFTPDKCNEIERLFQ